MNPLSQLPSVDRLLSAAPLVALVDLHGRSVNSPYLGTALPGRVDTTIHDGYLTVNDGELVDIATVAAAASRVAAARAAASHGGRA